MPVNGKRGISTAFVFAGTTEGRQVVERLLAHGVHVTAFTATGYGGEILGEALAGRTCEIRAGRLDAAAMERELTQGRPDVVIDATHPYAVLVSRHIKTACQKTGVRYLRLKRELGDAAVPCAVRVKSAEDAAAFLADKPGAVFLAIGAKEAAPFASDALRERVYIRILALEESLNRCRALRFSAQNIIAMQGPFSEALNTALFRECRAAWLVSKMSGAEGGFEAKLAAARACNMQVVLIEPPDDAGTVDDIDNNIEEIAGVLGLKAAVPLEMPPVPAIKPQKTIVLVSAGPGSAAFMTGEAREALKKSDCIIGAQVILDRHAPDLEKKPCKALYQAEEIAAFIEKSDAQSFAVLVSGDGGFFSLARTLIPVLRERGWPWTLLPGISSLTLLAARLGLAWDDVKTASLHGRGVNAVNLVTGMVSHHRKTFFLTDEKTTPAVICRILAGHGLDGVTVNVGEDLSLPTERIQRGTAASLVDAVFSPLNAVLVENPAPLDDAPFAQSCPYGLPDRVFDRGAVPMTKGEVRAVSLARLRIAPQDTVWDIGAGTGAVTCAAALAARYGRVYAVERDMEALELIRQNGEKLGLKNIEIIAGRAPDALAALPPPDAVFIGGSGGELQAIVEAALAKNPRCRLVITAITLETIARAAEIVRSVGLENIEITQLAVSRAQNAGNYRLVKAENPVFIFSGTGGGSNDTGGGGV